MRCSAPGRAKTLQTSRENELGPPSAARGWARPLTPPDGDAGLAGCGGEGLDRDAGLGGDVLEAALARLVLLAQPVRVDAAVRARGRVPEPGAGEELPDGAIAASGRPGDLAGPVSLPGERAELVRSG